jgi:hypothetical protein
MQELSIDCANDVQDMLLTVSESVGIYGRSPTASLVADLGGTAHAGFVADMHAGTTRALGLVHGTTAGSKVLVYAPVGVFTAVEDSVNGSMMLSKADLTLRPSAANNDDFRIVAI